MREEKKAAAPKSPEHAGTKTPGKMRERKLGALASKISVAPDFDETPEEVIEEFEGR